MKDSSKDLHDEQAHDQLDALPEQKGSSGGRPPMQRPETPHSGDYNGSTVADAREDRPGIFSPQDDTPFTLKKVDGPNAHTGRK